MRNYELTCIISSDFSEEKLMSYLPTEPIKKQLTSVLISLEFQAEPDQIKPLEKNLKGDPQIQRYMLLVKKPERLKAKPVKPKRVPKESKVQAEKPKVELKEIEKKLDEILKE